MGLVYVAQRVLKSKLSRAIIGDTGWQGACVLPYQFSMDSNLSVKKWLYNQHICYFFFGSWGYDGKQMKRQLLLQ